MESMQRIRLRIKSIGNTRQITQSMSHVSTAKIKTAHSRLDENQDFHSETQRLMRIAASNYKNSVHRYVKAPASDESVIIFIGGERGLCGNYPVNASRELGALTDKLGGVKIVAVGAKARDYCQRHGNDMLASFTGIIENAVLDDAYEISSAALDCYKKGDVGAVWIVCTQYVNMFKQDTVSRKLLPLKPEQHFEKNIDNIPGDENFLENFIPFYIAESVFRAMLESELCEQSSRLMCMDSAVKNADKLTQKLNMRYNQARQTAVTQEIAEIVNGANAVR